MDNSRDFRAGDFFDFGRHYAIDYRFPGLTESGLLPDDPLIARGWITERSLSSGFRYTFSHLQVQHAYESVSFGQAPLLILLVLEGHIRLSIGQREREVVPGRALTLQVHPSFPLQALQPSQSSLKILTLAFDPRGADVGRAASPQLHRLLANIRSPVHAWTPPVWLNEALANTWRASMPAEQQVLVLEGLALQLTGYGLPAGQAQPEPAVLLSDRQRERLEAVRQTLEFEPLHPYRFAELAERAAMSPSSLRSKFRAAYGLSVFEYLRRCRLELARQYLAAGYSVQQAAHKVGYAHAPNFSAAFRQHFGYAPKNRSACK
ncbi:MAG: helix-turn-helix transcriptional regulator [Alteromonadaceae bacterium]|nr:helix-turn-helix transcriptional regulator [Alteromonadaceae bacterium]